MHEESAQIDRDCPAESKPHDTKACGVNLFEIYEQEMRKVLGIFNQTFMELQQFEDNAIAELDCIYEEAVNHHKAQAIKYITMNNLVLEFAKDVSTKFEE
jgi:hypothetical protein